MRSAVHAIRRASAGRCFRVNSPVLTNRVRGGQDRDDQRSNRGKGLDHAGEERVLSLMTQKVHARWVAPPGSLKRGG